MVDNHLNNAPNFGRTLNKSDIGQSSSQACQMSEEFCELSFCLIPDRGIQQCWETIDSVESIGWGLKFGCNRKDSFKLTSEEEQLDFAKNYRVWMDHLGIKMFLCFSTCANSL